jgi:dihydroorotate dehydrogenase electron transfer subunit
MGIYTIKENRSIAKDIWQLELEGKDTFHCEVGQFMHVRVPGMPHLILRRPLSINDADASKASFSLVYGMVGEGTQALSLAKVGETLDAVGPLGRGFELPQSGSVWLCGGGLGVAPLLLAARRLKGRPKAFLGFQNQDKAYQTEAFAKYCSETLIATEDGSRGKKGSVILMIEAALKNDRPSMILACGPVPMLRALQTLLKSENIPCQVSLEERMGCGVGACLTCNCKTVSGETWHYRRVCKDGPVFDLSEVEI